MRRFGPRKLSDEELNEQYQVKSQAAMQLWETWMMMWTPIGFGKI
jgi:hypothetical protein